MIGPDQDWVDESRRQEKQREVLPMSEDFDLAYRAVHAANELTDEMVHNACVEWYASIVDDIKSGGFVAAVENAGSHDAMIERRLRRCLKAALGVTP